MTKQDVLLQTAIRLFVAKGFDNVSTSEIAKTAGVATGTLFNYFATKEALILASYQEAKRRFIEQTLPYLAQPLAKETFRFLWLDLIQWSLANQDWFYYLLQFRHSAYYRTNLLETDEGWRSLLGWWKEAIRDQLIKDMPLDLLLSLFTGILYNTIDYFIQHDAGDALKLANSFELCWDMICVK